MRLTIITPIYNSSNYLKAFFEMLDLQTSKNFNLVCIDDCSTDDSFRMLQENKLHHDYEVEIYQTNVNSGAGIARNIGLEHIAGEYVVFVDSDDILAPDYIEKLETVAQETNCDMCFFDFWLEGKNLKKILKVVPQNESGEISNELAIICANNACNKLFRSEVLMQNKSQFPPLRSGEDGIFARKFAGKVRKINYVPYAGYYYQYNPNSVTHRIKKSRQKIQQSVETILTSNTQYDYLKEDLVNYPNALFHLWLTESFLGGLKKLYNAKAPAKSYVRLIESASQQYPNWTTLIKNKNLSTFQKCVFYAAKRKSIVLIKLFMYIREKIS